MIVTIFTDASFDHRTHAAGWSAWIKFGPGEGQTQRYFGPIKDDCGCATGAELAAIANALFITAKSLKLSTADLVIVQSDSKDALSLADGKKNRWPVEQSAKSFRARCIAVVAEAKEKHGFAIEYRHVKGNQGGIDRRSWVNEWCDGPAKGEMRKLRAEKDAVTA